MACVCKCFVIKSSSLIIYYMIALAHQNCVSMSKNGSFLPADIHYIAQSLNRPDPVSYSSLHNPKLKESSLCYAFSWTSTLFMVYYSQDLILKISKHQHFEYRIYMLMCASQTAKRCQSTVLVSGEVMHFLNTLFSCHQRNKRVKIPLSAELIPDSVILQLIVTSNILLQLICVEHRSTAGHNLSFCLQSVRIYEL